MSRFDFKVGDKVYFPKMNNGVLTLAKRTNSEYPLKVILEGGAVRSFTTDGKHFYHDANPTIFPATQEWYDKLVHIYPDLEAPPKRKELKEIIQAMLNDGWKNIVCYVSDSEPNPNIHNTRFPLVVNAIEDGEFYVRNGYKWEYATPFDPKTGKTIVDYVNGEVVLED